MPFPPRTSYIQGKIRPLRSGCEAGGLKVNTDLAVIDENGEAIPGLYAIGNTSGNLYAVDYPINMPGNSNGRCLTCCPRFADARDARSQPSPVDKTAAFSTD